MPNRQFVSSSTYRYGFQNQEEDPELWDGAVTFKYRVEDPRLGRFFSADPLESKYPHNSPYAFSENVVINSVELEGLEKWEISTTTTSGNTTNSESGTVYGPYKDDQAALSGAKNGTADIFNYHSSSQTVSYNMPVGSIRSSWMSADVFRKGNVPMNTEGNSNFSYGTGMKYFQNGSLPASGACYQVGIADPFIDVAIGGASEGLQNMGMSENAAQNTAEGEALASAIFFGTRGRLGNTATRKQIADISAELKSRGYTITGGGQIEAEEFLKPLGGGRKGGSYPDITATHPYYPTLRINTVDVYKNGFPTLRELNNATRIRTQIPQGEHLLLIPKR